MIKSVFKVFFTMSFISLLFVSNDKYKSSEHFDLQSLFRINQAYSESWCNEPIFKVNFDLWHNYQCNSGGGQSCPLGC